MSHEHEPQPTPLTLEAVSRRAKEILLEHGEHVPMLLVEGSTQTLPVYLTEVADTPEGRQAQMMMAGYVLCASGEVGSLRQVFSSRKHGSALKP
jgi:hypothetical protein